MLWRKFNLKQKTEMNTLFIVSLLCIIIGITVLIKHDLDHIESQLQQHIQEEEKIWYK